MISVSCSSGGDIQVTPALCAANVAVPSPGAACQSRLPFAASRNSFDQRVPASGHSFSLRSSNSLRIEKALLQCHAVGQVEPFLVAAGMSLEPFLGRCGLCEGLEIPARMQAEAGPIRRAEKRHGHFRPVWRLTAVPVVIHLAGARIGEVVDSVGGELLRR